MVNVKCTNCSVAEVDIETGAVSVSRRATGVDSAALSALRTNDT